MRAALAAGLRALLVALLFAGCSSTTAGKTATTATLQRDHRSRLDLCQGASTVTRPLRPGDPIGGSDGGVDSVGANGEPVNSELGCTDEKAR